MPTSENNNRTLSRVATILDAVQGQPTSATQLARRCGLSVSTAHRLAVAMVEYGFLRREDHGLFSLGARFRRAALANAAVPALEELRDATGESAQLWVRSAEDRMCLAVADGNHELRATLPEGARLPLPGGSTGLLLAGDPEAVSSVAAHGWVESVGARSPGIASVSAPVHDGKDLVAAVCLALPVPRIVAGPGADHGAAVVRAAERISQTLKESAAR